ncbi:LysM peptidoglycan-binding domain-containing protein [Paenibacillus sp. HB172176]|uniref:LysM peptidoglycan-binding domain-containing protein n=1 Tax=Paenibacillus sp. HB172176 TaxID=2493690 RepID=UPI0014396081|nr:LysM peptidoglycan-binding domain-containing protein [Paenibacillus sp. HB172176]
MSNQTNGLRFDVYERVHLPDDVAAIDELEEIELVPRIQVIDQGDQAILRGQLLLSGVYRSQSAATGPLTLEHWIPVEISLPMNRVARLDDISIEIDNFDVDLLSARTLNITGVLSLRGISAESSAEQPLEWEEEPFTAVHEREVREQENIEEQQTGSEAGSLADEALQSAYEAEANEALSRLEKEQAYIADETTGEQFQSGEQTEPSYESALESARQQWSLPTQQSFAPSQQAEEQESMESGGQDFLTSNRETDQQIPSGQETDSSPIEALRAAEAEAEAVAEERLNAELGEAARQEEQPPIRQEVQIAFSGKSASPSEDESGLGFRSILQSSKREQAARVAAEEVVSQQQELDSAREQTIEEEIEWKKLFLSKQADENEFRKIRMCIVQKEETLEQIALRYSINPRELLVHNGLHESSVEEGQLLYIP